MKSPLGSIVRAGNTADGDVNANMIPTSLSSSAGDLSQSQDVTMAVDEQRGVNNNIDNSNRNASNKQNQMTATLSSSTRTARQTALQEAKSVLASLNATPSETNTVEQVPAIPPPPPPPPSETPDLKTPRSRSDAVAAAKRRAEERRKGNATPALSSKHNIATSTTTATNTTTTNAATNSTAANAKSTTLSNTNELNSMDWFNLLSPVANPSGSNPPDLSHTYSTMYSNHSSRRSRHDSSHHHNSSHSISHDHVSSNQSNNSSSGYTTTSSYASSLLQAAGIDTSRYESTAETITSSLDEFTGWFDWNSRRYLGTLPGLDGEDTEDGTGGGGIGGESGLLFHHHRRNSIIIWEEYEPEFGPEDVPELQRDSLPEEIESLDLTNVEEYLRRCGMLGMRFEDRGGGFLCGRERLRRWKRGEVMDDDAEEEDSLRDYVATTANNVPITNVHGEESNITNISKAIDEVPEIFFSPYFDLTDPICFEKLLVVSDEEVAEIRAKEAELHALAEQKVKEAEEVAKRDAENGVVAPRPPPRHHEDSTTDNLTNVANQSGASLTKDAQRTKTPIDGNVITLRKPETFTTHLDAIELALLDQVRSKSQSFFRETNRFSELQHLVTASVEEVRDLQTELSSLRERCVTNVELVPIMDDSRRDLRRISRVLEAVEDVVNCKASIASLMSVGDHLGAVETIRLARSLLDVAPEEGEESEDYAESSSHEEVNGESGHPPQHKLCLGKLKALSKVGEQLNEYEKLVVRNLTDELIDTFLSWGQSSTTGDENGSSVDYRAPPRVALSFDKRSKIRGVVQSLRLCGQLSGAGTAYQKRLCDLISVTVKAIVTECVADAKAAAGGGSGDISQTKGTMAGVASMSLDQFIDCINMLFEQVLGLLWGAAAVNKFCIEEGLVFDDKSDGTDVVAAVNSDSNGHGNDNAQHTPSATAAALAAAVDLAEKSVSELLRLRREAHSLVSFDGMRQLWDTSLTFTLQLERFSGRKAYGLRSTLLAQAKSFVERKHEANMSTLAAAMDSERWVQCNVSAERQAALSRLCSGRAAFTARNTNSRNIDNLTSPSASSSGRDKMADAEVEGNRYKVVWSCLLLLEMIMDDVACAAHFQTLATNVVGKVSELFRLFNTRSTQLVLGAGAIHSAARLKSINAKHLSIVTQCIALILSILPHVRAALMAQLPAKQHALLSDLDKIKLDYSDHNEKILGKLVSIIGGIVEHSLASKIPQTNFDTVTDTPSSLTDDNFQCTAFIESVVTNTKKMHQVLNVMLPPELLRDVFSRIFAYLDHKVPSLYKDYAAAKPDPNAPNKPSFAMPTTDNGKQRMVKEVEYMTKTLNCLDGVQPWHFTAVKVLKRELDIEEEVDLPPSDGESDEKKETDDGFVEPHAENNPTASIHEDEVSNANGIDAEIVAPSDCSSSNNDISALHPAASDQPDEESEAIDPQSNSEENNTPAESLEDSSVTKSEPALRDSVDLLNGNVSKETRPLDEPDTNNLDDQQQNGTTADTLASN